MYINVLNVNVCMYVCTMHVHIHYYIRRQDIKKIVRVDLNTHKIDLLREFNQIKANSM